MKYFKDREYVIKRAKFTYDNALFDGHGFMKWSKDEGFEVKLFVESDEYKKPKVQTFGSSSVIKKSDRQDIHLYFGNSINDIGLNKAIVPAAYLGERYDISMTGTLSFRTPQLVFLKNNFKKDSNYYFGSGIYRLKQEKYNFPETIHKQEKIGDEDLRKGWSRKGIQYRSENEYLIGWLEDDQYLHLQFGFKKDKYSQRFALNFPCGFRHSMSFLLGMEVKRLKSEMNGKNSNVAVIKKSTDVKEMPMYRGLKSFELFDSSIVWNLATFFTNGYLDQDENQESYVARRILAQLIEAEQQKTFAGQELLTSTILEATLRTLFNVPSEDDLYVPNYLKNNFISAYADGAVWRNVRKQVIKSFENIRHRNAHPDWLVKKDDVYDDDNISDTFYDLRVMIKFYQQMILLMAGIEGIEPKLPEKI